MFVVVLEAMVSMRFCTRMSTHFLLNILWFTVVEGSWRDHYNAASTDLESVPLKSVVGTCKSFIVGSPSWSFYEISDAPVVVFSIQKPVANETKVFSATHTIERVEKEMTELAFPSFRFIPQRSVVMFDEASVFTAAVIEELQLSKLILPNRDFFIFRGHKEDSIAHLLSFPKIETLAFKFISPEKAPESLHQLRVHAIQYNLNGKVVTAVGLPASTSYRQEMDSAGNIKASGAHHTLFLECSKHLNFTMSAYAVLSTGTRVNGTWTGLVGEIVSGRADIMFGVGIVPSRYAVVDMSRMLLRVSKIFFVKAPFRRLSPLAALQPFATSTWLALILASFVTMPILFVLIRRDSLFMTRRYVTTSCEIVGEVTGILVRLLMEQPFFLRGLSSRRTRCIIFMWVFSGLVLVTSYTSRLYLILAFQDPEPYPQTFDELAFSDYKLVYRSYGGAGYSQLKASKHPTHRAMLEGGRLQLVNKSEDCVIRMLTEEGTACIDYDAAAEFIIKKNATLHAHADATGFIKRSGDNDGRFIVAWGFQKHSPLTAIFDSIISQVMDSGLFGHWVQEDWRCQMYFGIRYLQNQRDSILKNELERMEKDLNSGVKPLALKSVEVAFVFVVIGACGGLVVNLVEHLHFKFPTVLNTAGVLRNCRYICHRLRRCLRGFSETLHTAPSNRISPTTQSRVNTSKHIRTAVDSNLQITLLI